MGVKQSSKCILSNCDLLITSRHPRRIPFSQRVLSLFPSSSLPNTGPLFPLLDSLWKYYDTKYVQFFFVMKVSNTLIAPKPCVFRFTTSFFGLIRVAQVGGRENIKSERIRSRKARRLFRS